MSGGALSYISTDRIMCEPTALAIGSLAIEAGSAVAEAVGQNQAASAQRNAALRDEQLQLRDLGVRQQEEQRASAQQIQEVRRETRQGTGLARVSAASAGVSGPSVDMLLDNVERSGAVAEKTLLDNEVITIDQLQRAKQGVTAEALDRIAGAPKANPLLAGLKIGAAGLNFATRLSTRTPKGS